MLTFLVQVEAAGWEAETEVGRLETSQLHLPPPLWKLAYFYWSQAGRSIMSCMWFLKCRVGVLGRWRTFPCGPAQSRFLLPPAFGQGCSRKKANTQSQLGEQLLGAVTLLGWSGPLRSSLVADFG